ncbi:hypothetical protein ACODT3_38330 [Streptomyces sp. 4.24]|uniref:hypothetical protein n=1 Tax=Streptomyces tritrimontium TaxID=3406573 RepID=UPI003BB5D27A
MASVAVLLLLTSGCRNDAAPAWGYPKLGVTLGALSRALEEACGGKAPADCADDLDRIDVLVEPVFAEVLDHRLLDDAYVEARTEVDRARELRLVAEVRARSRRDPYDRALARAVAAERLAYRHLLAALRAVRAAPPAGDGTAPV